MIISFNVTTVPNINATIPIINDKIVKINFQLNFPRSSFFLKAISASGQNINAKNVPPIAPINDENKSKCGITSATKTKNKQFLINNQIIVKVFKIT